ncbi:hypothetical protein [Phocaeicola sp.]
MDIIDVEERPDGSILLDIGRNSIYNSLPEFVFHPVDRFENIPQRERKERFEEEYDKQEKEKKDARKFFAPIDLLLLQTRLRVRECVEEYSSQNKILLDVIGDEITDVQRSNRFIKQVIPYLPLCKNIRGNRTLITLLLRKIFMEEGISIEKQSENKNFADEHPRYDDCLDSSLSSLYVGNEFDENIMAYHVSYWPDKECDDTFLTFIDETETFRQFMQDYFMSIEEQLVFNISTDEPPLRLSDTTVYNYLNYNTNI